MKNKNYITKLGHKKLVDELNQLLTKERPKITSTIQWAASNGDRSENADYIYGKKRLREIDRRSNFLRKRINNAQIIDPEKIASNKVKFGATVTVKSSDNTQKIFYIVGVDEINLQKNCISWKSPIGSKLLNCEVNDITQIKSPESNYELQVLAIEYQSLDFLYNT